MDKITPFGLNYLSRHKIHRNYSLLLFLCESMEYDDQFKLDQGWVANIYEPALNAILPASTGKNAGISAVYFLCGSKNGRKLLQSNAGSQAMLSEPALNAILPASAGAQAGMSAAYFLCGNDSGLIYCNPTLDC